MPSDKCPFSAVQAAALTRCELAREVVRRGGSEFDCTDPAACALCSALSRHLITTGFAALGAEDDLTVTPKSVYDRVQLGGLQGINALLPQLADDTCRTNIRALVAAMAERYPDLSTLPAEQLVAAIEAYRPPKRRRR